MGPKGAVCRYTCWPSCMHDLASVRLPCWSYIHCQASKVSRGTLSGAGAQGGWAADLKQGLGKKVYANGDVYEGLWRAGKCEGPGRYRWRNRNEYDGEWRAGRMHGKGTLKWNTGARDACP